MRLQRRCEAKRAMLRRFCGGVSRGTSHPAATAYEPAARIVEAGGKLLFHLRGCAVPHVRHGIDVSCEAADRTQLLPRLPHGHHGIQVDDVGAYVCDHVQKGRDVAADMQAHGHAHAMQLPQCSFFSASQTNSR